MTQSQDPRIPIPLSLLQRTVDVLKECTGPIGPTVQVVGEIQQHVIAAEAAAEASKKTAKPNGKEAKT